MAGILGQLLLALYYHQTVIWPPAGRPISTDLVDELLDNVEVDLCFLAPSVLEELSQSESSLEKLKGVKSVEFGGGQVPRTVPCRHADFNPKGLSLDVLVTKSRNIPTSSTF